MTAFSERLRKLRESLNLSQNEFSKRLGVSRVSLTHYEAGDRTPDIDFLKRLHEDTGVSIYYLLGLTDSKDDTLATAQRDTGLSEKALAQLTWSSDTTDLVNQFLSHDDFPVLAHKLMVIHDNELIIHDKKWYSPKGMQDTTKLKGETAALAEKILHSDPTPFSVNKRELPILAARKEAVFLDGLRALMERYETMYPHPTEEEKQLRAQGVYDYIHQHDDSTKEAPDAQETPEQ